MKRTVFFVTMMGTLGVMVSAMTPMAQRGFSQNPPARAQGAVPAAVTSAVERVAENNPVRQPAKALLPEIVAEVNGEKITRDQLASESMKIHGAEVLDRLLNRALVLAECKRKQIVVTQNQVNEEIGRMARGNRLSVDQFLEIVKSDNNMTPKQYAEEVVWPMLALRAIVADEVTVSPEEIHREYLKKYGPSVEVQMILVHDKAQAESIRERVVAAPDTFGDIAKNESADMTTAANKGRMQPVFRYTLPDPALEDRIFSLAPGEISEVIGPFGPQKDYMVFKGVKQYDSVVPQDKIDQIKDGLAANASTAKLKSSAATLFIKLKNEANVVNVLGDAALMQQYPNVAAMVNGQPVYLDTVLDKCLELYGRADCDGLIHRTLIRLECKKVGVEVAEKDIDTEIWIRAAETTMPLPDHSPNIAEYLGNELANYQVSEKIYRETIVRPALEVRKLSAPLVKVTDDDLQKSYEATFGEKVECLAIVTREQRHAQEAWQKARTLPTKENRPMNEVFGDLAAQYSVEPDSRQMRGRVPPIGKNGGQPQLEEEAFGLATGELSSIIQIDRETFVILLCLGRIPAQETPFDDAKETIQTNVRQMKEVIAAGEYYDDLMRRSSITNHLTGQQIQPATRTLP